MLLTCHHNFNGPPKHACRFCSAAEALFGCRPLPCCGHTTFHFLDCMSKFSLLAICMSKASENHRANCAAEVSRCHCPVILLAFCAAQPSCCTHLVLLAIWLLVTSTKAEAAPTGLLLPWSIADTAIAAACHWCSLCISLWLDPAIHDLAVTATAHTHYSGPAAGAQVTSACDAVAVLKTNELNNQQHKYIQLDRSVGHATCGPAVAWTKPSNS